MKNRDRDAPTFANINLLGRCNLNCFFCLGRDLPQVRAQNQLCEHYSNWKNFTQFVQLCRDNGIRKLYVTGQTADALQYKYLKDLIYDLQEDAFEVGLRTNGILFHQQCEAINACAGEIGYTIHSLNAKTLKLITGSCNGPDWDEILEHSGNNVRVAIVVNRYNFKELPALFDYVAAFPRVKYIQVRRVSTDHRLVEHEWDQLCWDYVKLDFEARTDGGDMMALNDYCGAPRFMWNTKELVLWNTVGTSVNSFNYFTDGVVSKEYFVVEGYENNAI